MRNLEEIYRENFFSRRNKLNWRSNIICNGLSEIFKLKKNDYIIDVGCATGDLVRELSIRGFNVEGIEGSSHAKKYFETNTIYVHDLRVLINNLSLYKKFNLVMCIEVAEHIEPEYSDYFMANLDYLTNEKIFITAAKPGQQGHYHVNCQLPKYWIDKFKKYNFEYRDDMTYQIKKYFEPWKRKKGLSFFYENSLIFERVP